MRSADLIFGAKLIRRINADPAKFFTADTGIRVIAKIWINLADSCTDENVFIISWLALVISTMKKTEYR